MLSGTETNLIAWWGAGLSTLLALIKLWEIFRKRFRIETDCSFTSSVHVGNKVFIRNLNDFPIIISYWELGELKGSWPFRKFTAFSSHEYDDDITVDRHSTYTLLFAEQYYFKAQEYDNVYLKLVISGKGKLIKKLY